jgi:hypothetical protein
MRKLITFPKEHECSWGIEYPPWSEKQKTTWYHRHKVRSDQPGLFREMKNVINRVNGQGNLEWFHDIAQHASGDVTWRKILNIHTPCKIYVQATHKIKIARLLTSGNVNFIASHILQYFQWSNSAFNVYFLTINLSCSYLNTYSVCIEGRTTSSLYRWLRGNKDQSI